MGGTLFALGFIIFTPATAVDDPNMLHPHRLVSAVVGIMVVLVLAPAQLPAQSNTALSATEPSAAIAPSTSPERCYRRGRWHVVETDNFVVCCDASESSTKLLAHTAESLRRDLQKKWLGEAAASKWNPKCRIVLHPSLESYLAACGRGSEHTVGSSLVKVAQGEITNRQIDLLGGRADFLSAALPHELTHVVLKDRFPNEGLPRWADEGIAILADTEAKQGRHLRDLQQGIANHTLFDTPSLVALEDYPGSDRMGVFYGQSVSLVKFLVDEKDPGAVCDVYPAHRSEGIRCRVT